MAAPAPEHVCGIVYRCTLCETEFEEGVADSGEDGAPRCPQCGFCDAEHVGHSPGDGVIRRTTKFR